MMQRMIRPADESDKMYEAWAKTFKENAIKGEIVQYGGKKLGWIPCKPQKTK